MPNKERHPMNRGKKDQTDATEKLNAFVDDLADLAADLHLEGKLKPRPPADAAGSPAQRVRRSKTATSSKAGTLATRAASVARADAIASAAEPERTRLLVLISAWWTLAQMTNTGVSFEEFIAAAVSKEPRARPLWDDLTERLHKLTVAGLEQWPEAVLSPEVREFIEALVTTMGPK
jgi:hypothetical protein